MRRNFISVLPRRCAAFFLESPAPCAGARSRAADGRFQPPDPHRQGGGGGGRAPAGGIAAALEYAGGDPAFPRSPASRQERSIEAAIPSSRAIWLNGRPLLAS